jgi:hypothetical protein
MTLILAMSASNAICMSVDSRVTNPSTREIIDRFAVKSLIVRRFMPGSAEWGY